MQRLRAGRAAALRSALGLLCALTLLEAGLAWAEEPRLDDPRPAERVRALDAFARATRQPLSDVAPVVSLLADPDWEVRQAAGRALARARAIPALVDALETESARVRRAAEAGLRCAEPEDLAEHENLLLFLGLQRYELWGAIRRMGPRLSPATIQAFASEEPEFFSEADAWALEPLRAGLRSEGAARRGCVEALGYLGWRARSAERELSALLRDPDPELSQAAAYTLGRLGLTQPLVEAVLGGQVAAADGLHYAPSRVSVSAWVEIARGARARAASAPDPRDDEAEPDGDDDAEEDDDEFDNDDFGDSEEETWRYLCTEALQLASDEVDGLPHLAPLLAPFLCSLFADPVDEIALSAISASRPCGPLAMEPLRAACADPRPGVRLVALEALVDLDASAPAGGAGSRIADLLWRLSAEDPALEVRQVAARALAARGADPAPAEALLEREEDPAIRASLQRLAWPLERRRVAWRAALGGEDEERARSAARALIEAGEGELLGEALRSSGAPPEVFEELYALGDDETCLPLPLDVLVWLLEEGPLELRTTALILLGRVSPREGPGRRALIRALDDPSEHVRERAGGLTLGEGNAEVFGRLLAGPNEPLAREAALAWGRGRDPEVRAILRQLAADGTPFLIQAALEALQPEQQDLPLLREVLNGPHWKAALPCLERLGPAAEPLLPLLVSRFPDPDALSAAAQLGARAAPVVEPLRRLLTDPERADYAFSTLGRLGPIARPALEDMLASPALDDAGWLPVLDVARGDPASVARVVSALLVEADHAGEEHGPETVFEALSALGAEAQAAAPFLADLCCDPSLPQGLRAPALEALREVAPAEAARVAQVWLGRLYVAPRPDPHEAALIASIDSQAAASLVPVLRRELEREGEEVDRDEPAAALARLGPAGRAALLAASLDPREEVGGAAIEALRSRPEPAVQAALAQALRSPSARLRRDALYVLIAWCEEAPALAPWLSARLGEVGRDRASELRQAAFEGLTRLGPRAGLSGAAAFAAALEEPAPRARELRRLGLLGLRALGPELLVRAAAASPALAARLEELLARRAPGAIVAAELLLDLDPERLDARAFLREVLPSLPRELVTHPARSLGQDRPGRSPEDRAVALRELLRSQPALFLVDDPHDSAPEEAAGFAARVAALRSLGAAPALRQALADPSLSVGLRSLLEAALRTP